MVEAEEMIAKGVEEDAETFKVEVEVIDMVEVTDTGTIIEEGDLTEVTEVVSPIEEKLWEDEVPQVEEGEIITEKRSSPLKIFLNH